MPIQIIIRENDPLYTRLMRRTMKRSLPPRKAATCGKDLIKERLDDIETTKDPAELKSRVQ